MPTAKVIDLSHHNTIPSSLKPAKNAGIMGVIHKATESTSYRDEKLAARYALAKDAGMLFGGYHFIRPGSIPQQADFFVREMQKLGDDANFLYALDWEDSAVSAEDALAFMQRIEELTGHEPVLYSGHVCKEDPDPRLWSYRLWLAQYGTSCTLPQGAEEYWIWQFTDKGTVPGVNPPTDLNTYTGTDEDLAREWAGIEGVEPLPDELVATVTVNIEIDAPPGVRVAVVVNTPES